MSPAPALGVRGVQCLGQCVCRGGGGHHGDGTLDLATHCHTLPATRDKTAQPQSPIDCPHISSIK